MTEQKVYLDTESVEPGDREEFVRNALSTGMRLDLENLSHPGKGLDMRFAAVDVGPIGLGVMELSPTAATRDWRLARDDWPPTLSVLVKQSGTSRAFQEGRSAVFGPNELVMLLSNRPNAVVSPEHSHRRMLQIPLDQLAVPEATLRQATAVPLSRDLPLAGVLGRLVEALPLQPELRNAEGEHLARATLDLVRGLVVSAFGDEQPASRAQEATLQLQIADYLRMHWREHDLTADRLAAVHHISSRQLYRLLAAEGISLGDWLRQRRLEACRDELAGPRATTVAVAAVGRRWGFPDATNFGRAFKASFGVTPQQWRLLHQR